MTDNNKNENEGQGSGENNTPPSVPNPYRFETPFQREVPISLPNNNPYTPPSAYVQSNGYDPYAAPYNQNTSERPPNPYNFPYDTPPAPPQYQQQYNYQPSSVAQQQRRPARRIQGETQPFWTYGLLLAIIGMFVVQMLRQGDASGGGLGLSSGFTNRVLLDLGALNPQLVRQGEWWRLITVMFLHGSLLHIVFNGLALYQLGMQLEQWVGPVKFPIIYFFGGLGGSILSFGLGNPNQVAVGASGAIFALLGAMIGFLARHRYIFGQMGRAQLNSLIITALLNFAISLSIPNIDNFAHFGGLIAGAFLGYFMQSEFTRQNLPAPRDPGTSARAITLVQEWWPVLALVAAEVVLFFFFLNQPGTAYTRR